MPIKDLNEAIRQATSAEAVCSALDALAGEIKKQIERQRHGREDIRTMASRVAEIRVLLQQLERHEVKACRDASDISRKYLELEGKIKEIRNDLDRLERHTQQ